MKKYHSSTIGAKNLGAALLLCGLQVANAKDYSVKEVYASMSAEGDGAIVAPERCSEDIDAGGHYVEAGKILKGKCVQAGLPAVIKGPRPFQRYVSFAIDPAYAGARPGNDRAELAHTADYFPFGMPFQIGFRMMIPSASSATSGDVSFFALQLWQCDGPSPIAGLRIAPGTSHQVQFFTKNDTSQATRFTAALIPDVWHQIVLSVTASPIGGANFQAHMDGKLLGASTTPYGYVTSCPANESGFRVKYGIYKEPEPGKYFEVNYDDFRIANRWELVKPWN